MTQLSEQSELMNGANTTADAIADQAQRLLQDQVEHKLALLRDWRAADAELAQVMSRVEAAKRRLDEAWKAMQAAGWTNAELKQIGVAKPTRTSSRNSRPRRTKNRDDG